MPKDQPIRNPDLSPAGLSRGEIARHRPHPSLAAPGAPRPEDTGSRCRFTSSLGGVLGCGDAAYQAGFCRFHYDCLVRGEISPLGRILDVVKSQDRRREINHHGIRLPAYGRLSEDPVTGGDA